MPLQLKMMAYNHACLPESVSLSETWTYAKVPRLMSTVVSVTKC